jgi:hypothetical protein
VPVRQKGIAIVAFFVLQPPGVTQKPTGLLIRGFALFVAKLFFHESAR